jgi:hypothetical protein
MEFLCPSGLMTSHNKMQNYSCLLRVLTRIRKSRRLIVMATDWSDLKVSYACQWRFIMHRKKQGFRLWENFLISRLYLSKFLMC